MAHNNLYEDLPAELPEELVDVLAEGDGRVRVERIVSRGHASPPGFWYDQETAEWVVLLRGVALLRFEDEAAPRVLRVGDWVEIAPHRKHRVEYTSPDVENVWLAVHWG